MQGGKMEEMAGTAGSPWGCHGGTFLRGAHVWWEAELVLYLRVVGGMRQRQATHCSLELHRAHTLKRPLLKLTHTLIRKLGWEVSRERPHPGPIRPAFVLPGFLLR